MVLLKISLSKTKGGLHTHKEHCSEAVRRLDLGPSLLFRVCHTLTPSYFDKTSAEPQAEGAESRSRAGVMAALPHFSLGKVGEVWVLRPSLGREAPLHDGGSWRSAVRSRRRDPPPSLMQECDGPMRAVQVQVVCRTSMLGLASMIVARLYACCLKLYAPNPPNQRVCDL